jgi:DNA polymerase (family 10)
MLAKKKIYTNNEIAELLTNIATAYEIKKKNFFRIVSYQNAAETILTYPKPIQEVWEKDRKLLDNIPSIGEHIMEKLDYLFKYNKYHPDIIKAFKGIHPAVFTFTKINGIGPRIAYVLTRNLKFSEKPLKALDQLMNYAKEGKIRGLPRFGQKSEQAILENTLHFLGQHRRLDFKEANEIAQNIINYMKKKFPDVEFIPLGSLRRHSATVGDIDIAAKSENTEDILSYFVSYPNNIQTISKGPKKASIRIYHDIRVDLMVQPPKTFGSLVQHFTGSRQHNILLRRYAQSMGLSVSEYGIKDLNTGKNYTFENEVDLYNFLKLAYIEPDKRVGEFEIDEAQKWYNKKVKV